MQMLALSPELCGKIVEFMTSSRQDLLSLCLTCKAFQREAEIRIYTSVELLEPEQALIACHTLSSNDRLAQYVKQFWFNQEYPPRRASDTNLGRDFWTSIQLALIAVYNLENLLISDASHENGWILDTPEIQFQLRELKLRFTWDDPIVRFLDTQTSLRSLHFYYFEEVTHQIHPQNLPELRLFDGSLTIGTQFVQSSITHLQLVIDCEPVAALSFFPRFGSLRKTLRGVSLLDLPDDISLPTLDILSRFLPDLRHVGLFPYPMAERHEFHRYLMRMHYLQVIELDLGRWVDRPASSSGQRALASEIRTFCPTIRVIIFWISHNRYKWVHNSSQWEPMSHSRTYPQLSNIWCMI